MSSSLSEKTLEGQSSFAIWALPATQLSITLAVVLPLHAVAMVATVFRLCRRFYRHQLWWDDYWALTALVCDLVFVMVNFWPVRKLE